MSDHARPTLPRGIRILVVEDNPGDADLIRDTLRENVAHIEITVVADGADAVEYLKRHQDADAVDARAPDFVLLDLNLPKMHGHEVLAEARKFDRLKSLPIIIVTSSDATRDIITSYELGANCYVTKPVDLEKFIVVVRSIDVFWLTVVTLPPNGH